MANEKRLIDANVLKWKLGQVTLYVPWLRFGKTVISKILESYRRCVFEEIDNALTVDAVEVVHGRWEKYARYMICSECDIGFCYYKNETHRFRCCPNCGAKMDGEGREGE